MSRRSFQVVALVVGISILLPLGPLSARPLAGAPQGQPPGLLASVWGGLASLWSGAGCELDPNGRCVSSHGSAWPARGDRGPGQRRLINVQGTAGCELDPDGRSVKSPGTGSTCGAVAGGGAIVAAPR